MKPVMTFIRLSLMTIFDGGLVGEDEDDLKQVQRNTTQHITVELLIHPLYQCTLLMHVMHVPFPHRSPACLPFIHHLFVPLRQVMLVIEGHAIAGGVHCLQRCEPAIIHAFQRTFCQVNARAVASVLRPAEAFLVTCPMEMTQCLARSGLLCTLLR